MCLALSVACASPLLADLELGGPTEPPPPPAASFNAARARIRQLEQEIARRLESLRAQGQYNQMAINADINLRVIARKLLTVGAAAERDGAVAMLYGYTLANQADAIERQLAKLPLRVTAVKAAENPPDEDLRVAANFAEAVGKFNEIAQREAESLTDATPAAVDRYLAKFAPSLDAVRKAAAEEAGQKPDAIATTWVASPPPSARPAPAAPPQVPPDQLAELDARVRQAPLPRQTRQELSAMIDDLRRASDDAGRDRAAELLPLMDVAVSIGEGLGIVEWLDASLANEFRQQLHTAIVLSKDGRTRDAGRRRLVSMGATLRLAARTRRLGDLAVPTAPIGALLGRWYAMHDGGQDPAIAGELYDYLDRLTDAMGRYRELLTAADLPPDLRRVALDLRTEYQRQELALLGALPRLGGELDAVADARWADPLNELVTRVNRLNRVHRLNGWIAALDRYKPRPAGGVARRLRDLALSLNDAGRAPAADAQLRSLEERQWLLESLTYEGRLREPDDAITQITGSLDLLLVQQIDRLRQDWATAWAGGGDTDAPAERLLMLDRLGRLIRIADAVRGIDDHAVRLNAWAAWETAPSAITPLARSLPDGVREACRLASIGNWAPLEAAMDQIERAAPLPLLVAQLARRVTERIGDRSDGLAAAVGQMQGPADATAFARSQRLTLAQLSVELTEAAHERSIGRTDRADALAEYLGLTALELLDALDRADAGPVKAK